MSEGRNDLGEISFLIRAVLRWFEAALLLLAVVSLVLAVSGVSSEAFGYVSSALSFAAAVFAGSAAAHIRGKGGIFTGLVVGAAITTLLLTIGFIIAGDKLGSDGVLSVATFTLSGCAVGSVFFMSKKRKPNKKTISGRKPRLT